MSQPPPPPNQPPSGGFGAPQDQPPGGFGPQQDPQPGGFGPPASTPAMPPASPPAPAQTPPPAQGPGYGYPQPATPPQQPYGYPQTPPGPTGYPQQPGYGYPNQQPGYGYPNQQPGYGYPQPGTVPMQPGPAQSSGRKGLGAQVWIIVSAVVAIALIVGGGVWYAKSSSGGDGPHPRPHPHPNPGANSAKEKVPADPKAELVLQLPAPKITDNDEYDTIAGSWLTDSVYAKAGINKIVGYRADTGTTAWTLPLNGQACAGSHEVSSSGVAVVITETRKRTGKDDHVGCGDVTAFDVSSGKLLWTKSISVSDDPIRFEEVAISGNTAAAAGYEGGAGFDLANGKILWQPKAGSCQDMGYAGGEQLVAERQCGDYDNETYQIQVLEPATGAVKSTYSLPRGLSDAKVISTKPVVFGVESGATDSDTGISDVFSLDDSGKLRTKISLSGGKYDPDCEKINTCHGIAVGNDMLYVPTKKHDGSADYSDTNEIVAFSLATGKMSPNKTDAGDDCELYPIRMDGPNLLAYKEGSYNEGAQVVTIDAGTMKASTLLKTPSTEQARNQISDLDPESSELLFAHGRLFLARDSVDRFTADEKENVALGYGVK
ncbi:PQQ-binding-like beta-propeller repeat protein [Streptomyces sp. NPDC047022]|uniref:outer membrane protein assembly factor BamB family protein n=1 Tax=Streptomyces sp. NPDC047022 TaxID=3155737 RepID=UPI0033EC38A1